MLQVLTGTERDVCTALRRKGVKARAPDQRMEIRRRGDVYKRQHQGWDDLRRRGPGPVPDANGRAAAVAEGSKPVLLHAGAGGLKEGFPMNELKGLSLIHI